MYNLVGPSGSWDNEGEGSGMLTRGKAAKGQLLTPQRETGWLAWGLQGCWGKMDGSEAQRNQVNQRVRGREGWRLPGFHLLSPLLL